jgi:hypothetical protein
MHPTSIDGEATIGSTMTTPSTQADHFDAGILGSRVRLFLEGGHSYPEALRRAYLAPREIDQQPDRWLRPQEAAAHLGISIGELPRAKAAGVPYHQMENCNGLCLFLASELDRWRQNHERLPRTAPKPVRRSRYRPRFTVEA